MSDLNKYRVFFINGTSFDISAEDGEDIIKDLDDPAKTCFEVVMRKTLAGSIIRKFPREALEGIEYYIDD